jgi:hypothetical protein
LQFAQANAQPKNCKRAYFTNRTDTATLDGQTMDEKEGRRHNTGLASLIFNWQKWRSETSEQCSADIPQYCGMVKIATFAKAENDIC